MTNERKETSVMNLKDFIEGMRKWGRIIHPVATRWHTDSWANSNTEGLYRRNMLGTCRVKDGVIDLHYSDYGQQGACQSIPLHLRVEELTLFRGPIAALKSVAERIATLRGLEVFRNEELIKECRKVELTTGEKSDVYTK